MRSIKKFVKRLIGDRNTGRLEYFLELRNNLTRRGPFNGQKFRQLIFFDLLYHFPIKALVETGTFQGTTTALFTATSLPVFTAELHPRYFSYAKMRFLFNRTRIQLFQGDSRSFLRKLSADQTVPKEDVFFYLDAHWHDDLPLLEEIEIIFSEWKRPIVMVDDFHVPNTDYKFDDYGEKKTLNLDYIDPVVSSQNISVFFPTADSSEETGARRGCVVLCQDETGKQLDAKIKSLVRYEI